MMGAGGLMMNIGRLEEDFCFSPGGGCEESRGGEEEGGQGGRLRLVGVVIVRLITFQFGKL